MSTKVILESKDSELGKVETNYEDGGCAMIGNASFKPATVIIDGFESQEPESEGDGFFVRLQSWHEHPDLVIGKTHPIMRRFDGKKIRVTIEEID